MVQVPGRGLVRPDAVLYLNIDAARGRGFGEERYEAETLREVRAQFEKLTEDWWTVVDADRTVEQVARVRGGGARRRRAVRAWRGVQRLWGLGFCCL